MLNPQIFYNSRPDGYSVLQIADDETGPGPSRRFIPLKHTNLVGAITGPLASLTLTQTFSLPAGPADAAIEALYRFPLPGDAAVTGVRVRFGEVEIYTRLKARESAEAEYQEAKQTGRQAAVVTRESPDVFTLRVSGIVAGQDVVVRTEYLQLAKPDGAGWSLRVPLTTSPRFVREDESDSRHAAGQPLSILRDPGHRFSLDLRFSDAEQIASSTHGLAVEGERVRLRDGEVLPDRDCVITWRPLAADRPALRVWTEADNATGKQYLLALCAPHSVNKDMRVPREVILLVDHSGSMEGAKWEAADWAVERFLAGLNADDSFALGLFHDTTKWWAKRPRKAGPDAVREAVAFLKSNRQTGGTQLGVALEQALDLARTAETPARHVLVLTDAEVSDAGRILQLADGESIKLDRRRISVLCIDSAPNEGLASELAERGGGVARYLTSNPDDDDITTALDEVLADWSAPVLANLKLEVNSAQTEACGRMVTLIAPGPNSAIDMGDLPAERPVWVIARAPESEKPLSFRLCAGTEVYSESRADSRTGSGLKALFGAKRVRRLEYLMHANHSGEELQAELTRLGYEATSAVGAKVYAENSRVATAKAVSELLVRESLSLGVPCSETAFVAVRNEPGQVVTETVVVANALPHGWSEHFAGAKGGYASAFLCASMAAPAAGGSVDSYMVDFDALESDPAPTRKARKQPPAPPPRPGAASFASRSIGAGLPGATPSSVNTIRILVADREHSPADGAVLYDSATGDAGRFTYLSVAFIDANIAVEGLDSELKLLLFIGDLASPRAQVKLADVLRQGGRRPLNLRRDPGQQVRLVLADPSGAWCGGAPAMEVVIG